MENLLLKNQIDICGLGIDLSKDYSQISYMNESMGEPDSMSVASEEKRYLIPTCLYKLKQLDEWCIGEEAFQRAKAEENRGNFVENLLELVDKEKGVVIEDKEFSASTLLEIFIERLMKLAKEIIGFRSVSHIAVTIEEVKKNISQIIISKFKAMGYKEENIRVISHTEAFIYYVINQRRELWVNDVVLFDFSNYNFRFRRMRTVKNRIPRTITVEEEDLTKYINSSYLETETDRERLDEKFTSLILERFGKNIISSVFLTGIGFYDEWAKNSIKELCNRRHVFKGYNLFVKGACYAAMKRYRNITDNEFLFNCKGRTKANVGIVVSHQERNMTVLMSRAGENWYEAGAKTECILDNIHKINFIVSSPDNMRVENVEMDLSVFPERVNKATRVEISIGYINDNTFDIAVKDLGFGDFFKSSDMVIRKTVNVDEILK